MTLGSKRIQGLMGKEPNQSVIGFHGHCMAHRIRHNEDAGFFKTRVFLGRVHNLNGMTHYPARYQNQSALFFGLALYGLQRGLFPFDTAARQKTASGCLNDRQLAGLVSHQRIRAWPYYVRASLRPRSEYWYV